MLTKPDTSSGSLAALVGAILTLKARASPLTKYSSLLVVPQAWRVGSSPSPSKWKMLVARAIFQGKSEQYPCGFHCSYFLKLTKL